MPEDDRKLSRRVRAMALARVGMVVVLAAAVRPLGAQTFIDPASAHFSRFDAEAGLSQSSVQALAEDSEGRIWIGTLNGLNRFDGRRNTVFLPRGETDGELADNYVAALLADRDGGMWVGTLDGVSLWDPSQQRFRNFRHDPAQPDGLPASLTLALHRDARGTVWAGTERGLARWDPAQQRFRRWPPALEPGAGLPDARVTALASTADGQL